MQDNHLNNQTEEYDLSVLEELNNKAFNLQETIRELFFYILPVASFLFFLIILFSAIIPTINDIGVKLDKVDQYREEEKKLSQRIEKIKALDQNATKNQQVIDKINEIVPTGQTEVVKFGERIILSLSQNTLINEGIKSGEAVIVSPAINNTSGNQVDNQEIENSLSIRQIPSEFDVSGNFEDIRKFFIQLYKGPDFFVVDSMSLKNNDDLSWSGEISLAKYQFSESQVFDPIKAYTSVNENTVLNELVMRFIETRFVDNQIEITNQTP